MTEGIKNLFIAAKEKEWRLGNEPASFAQTERLYRDLPDIKKYTAAEIAGIKKHQASTIISVAMISPGHAYDLLNFIIIKNKKGN